MHSHAKRHLARDPMFTPFLAQAPTLKLKGEKRSPYEALVRAIAHQQLHGKAAEAILGRFVALYPDTTFPKPAQVLATDETLLRGAGFSASKIAAIRDICISTVNRVVPARAAALKMVDAELIERLTSIRGVGRWTVEMLLIFTLGRADVLPVDDFGVREGYRRLMGDEAQPKPRALAAMGEAWAPYRSYAALYLWHRANEKTLG